MLRILRPCHPENNQHRRGDQIIDHHCGIKRIAKSKGAGEEPKTERHYRTWRPKGLLVMVLEHVHALLRRHGTGFMPGVRPLFTVLLMITLLPLIHLGTGHPAHSHLLVIA